MKHKSQPVIYQVEIEYTKNGDSRWQSLEVSQTSSTKLNKQLEKMDKPSSGSLAKGWKAIPVSIEWVRKVPDCYNFDTERFAFSLRAKGALGSLIQNHGEFLPLQVVSEQMSGITERPCRHDYPELFVIHPFTHVAISPNAEVVYVGPSRNNQPQIIMHIEKYAFDSAKLQGLHIFKVLGDSQLLVSEEFVQLYRIHRLTGLKFKRLKYVEGGAKVEIPRPPPRLKTLVPAPVPVSPMTRAMKEMTDELWKKWTEQLDWVYRALKTRGMDVRKPRYGKPFGNKGLRALEAKLQLEFPVDFASVLENFASSLDFSWTVQKNRLVDMGEISLITDDPSQYHPDDLPPEPFEHFSGGGVQWNAQKLAMYKKGLSHYQKMYTRPKNAYERAFMDKLCILETGSGDMIALDVAKPRQPGAVVYLSHDGDDSRNNRPLGESFLDYMTRCINWGSPDVDVWGLDLLYDKKGKGLMQNGKLLKRWRSWLETGK